MGVDIRTREALHVDGEQVRPEYAIIASMDKSDAWLSIQRRERIRFDEEREIVCDLKNWR